MLNTDLFSTWFEAWVSVSVSVQASDSDKHSPIHSLSSLQSREYKLVYILLCPTVWAYLLPDRADCFSTFPTDLFF